MIVHNKLTKIIPFLPHIIKGEYNLFSFVLIGGSSYKSVFFDKFDPGKNDNFYKEFKHESEYPNINFQTRLSKISITFSFDRPTDLLNNNLYGGEKYKNIYVASLKDLTIKNYAKFIYDTLTYYKIKPPYVFIVFSEGGYDVLCFSKYYSNLIKNIYFVDTPFLEQYLLKFEKFRGGKDDPNQGLGFMKRLSEKKFSWDGKYKSMKKNTLIKIDLYNFEIKTYNIILKLNINDFPKEIPIVIFWSPYFDSPTKKSTEKIKIIKTMNTKLSNNIKTLFVDAPHQMERVIPITLSKYIIKNIQ